MTSVPKTKRQEYLAAQALANNLEDALRTLSNRLFQELSDAEKAATSAVWETLESTRNAAIDKFKKDHEADYAQLDDLRTQASSARRMFSGYQYACDHRDEEGNSAVQPQWSFGMDLSDKPTMRCSVCGEFWK